MPRSWQHEFTLSDGRKVPYSLKDRNGLYGVLFPHPTGAVKYVEKATGCRSQNDAHTEAARIVLRVYSPTLPTLPTDATWDDALKHLENTPDLRADSIRGYKTAVKAFRRIIDTARPADVTEANAHKFKREFLTGRYSRGHAADAATYKRTATTCTTYLRSLRSLWSVHWKAAGFVKNNPWLEVPYPNAPKGKRVRMPAEDDVTALMTWLHTRFPEWDAPALFTQVKAVAGCRTLDLCKVPSADLDGNVLLLSADVTKQREDRTVTLPAELADRLHQIKGPVYLWERTLEQSKTHYPSVKTKSRTAFTPETWRNTVQSIFRGFNDGREAGKRVRPHDLRARAITLVAAATQNVDQTAAELKIDPQTARHYLDAAKAFKGGILAQLAGVLTPKSPTTSGQSPTTSPTKTPT